MKVVLYILAGWQLFTGITMSAWYAVDQYRRRKGRHRSRCPLCDRSEYDSLRGRS